MDNVDLDTGFGMRPLEAIGTSASWVRTSLERHGLSLHADSGLNKGLGALAQMRTTALAGNDFRFRDYAAAFRFFATAIGADFVTKALHSGWDSGLRLPAQRWKDLVSGDPIICVPGTHTQHRALVWELVIASIASQFATDVRLEEPDVVCKFAGRTYAIAAKIPVSKKKLFENVEAGFAQANAKADAALVFVDIVDIFPVELTFLWSVFRRFQSNTEGDAVMTDAVNRWCRQFELDATVSKLRSRTRQPVGVAFFVPLLLVCFGQPVPMLYTHLPISWKRDSGPDYEFVANFLRVTNDVLGFTPLEPAP